MTDQWKDRILIGLVLALLGTNGVQLGVVEPHKTETINQIESVQEIKWIDIIDRLDRIEEMINAEKIQCLNRS